jgi:kinesin family protein 5
MINIKLICRAKTIENKAKVNADLSPAELKIQLKKANAEITNYVSYSGALVGEVVVWRSGNPVPECDWVPLKVVKVDGLTLAPKKDFAEAAEVVSAAAAMEIEEKREVLPSDEREEFLKRENDLADQLDEKEKELKKNFGLLELLEQDHTLLKEKEAKVSMV